MLQDVINETTKPVRKRALAGYLEEIFDVSERRACQVLKFARSSHANRVYRLYTEKGLTKHRKRPRRRVSAARRVASQPKPKRSNESWSMDFVSDQLYSAHQLRVLTIVDNFSRESLAVKAGQSLRGDDVVAVLNQLIAKHGAPPNPSR